MNIKWELQSWIQIEFLRDGDVAVERLTAQDVETYYTAKRVTYKGYTTVERGIAFAE